MKPDLNIAMVQMDIANDPQENAERYLDYARQAATEGADIVVGSEMMLAQYLRGDSYEDEEFVRAMWRAAMTIKTASKFIDAVLIFGGIGLDKDGTLVGQDGRVRKYNAAFVVHHGKLVHNRAGLRFAIKTLLPNYRIFDDSRHFFSLRELAEENNIRTEALLQPFVVNIRGVEYQLGVMSCEDMWDMDYCVKPAQTLKENGADILINLSCSNWSWRKNAKRDSVIKGICEDTGLPFVYVNNVGVQNNGKNFITFDGASTAYDGQGNIIALSEPYEEQLLVVDFKTQLPAIKRNDPIDIAQMFTAIEVATLGFIKTQPAHLNKVVIGVSGGIDSALSVAFFAHLLGPENVIGVNMPYKHYNADETKDDAKQLCENLGVEYRICPIDDIVDATAALAGAKPGIGSHKTIQATTRLQVLAGIGATENAWFPCNANWTETFFGYGTLNGDMRGVFAPWMNCLKQDIFRLAHFMNRDLYGREVIPQSIIDRAPMDELTAEGGGERKDPFDYGCVTEYGYHDQMVRAVIAFRRGPAWFVEQYLNGTLEQELQLPQGKLNVYFESDGKKFLDDLERCFKLYQAAVFKRVQSVPGPLVDKRTFGWDFRESIGTWFDTAVYLKVCKKLEAAGFPHYQPK